MLRLVKSLKHRGAAVVASVVAAVALCFPVAAFGVVFNQSGSTVQITTVNDSAPWSFDVHWTDTTETPVPRTDGKKLGDWSVTAGQTAYSIVLPDAHRRYRFDVTSVKPSQQTTDTVPAPAGSFHGGAGWGPLAEWRHIRGVQVLHSGSVDPLAPSSDPGAFSVQVGDTLGLYTVSGLVANSAVTFASAGDFKSSTLRATLNNYGDEETDDFWFQWVGAYQLVRGVPALDDSGSGTFENPTWVGFSVEPTPSTDPTFSVDPTPSVDPSASAPTTVVAGIPEGAWSAIGVFTWMAGLLGGVHGTRMLGARS